MILVYLRLVFGMRFSLRYYASSDRIFSGVSAMFHAIDYVLHQLLSRVAIWLLLAAGIFFIVSGNAHADEELVNKCSICHGKDGNSISPFAPSIAGMQKYYLEWVVDAYINNNRPAGIMKDLVDKLTPAEIAELADYFSRQKFVPATQEFNKELALQGEKLHNKYCEKCHENGGEVTNELPGIIAGQWMGYTRTVLNEYIDGKRKGNTMMMTKLKKMIKNEGFDSIENLVHYYGSRK